MSFLFNPNSNISFMMQVLQGFGCESRGKTKPPKKEYVRIKVIRGHKRCFRQMHNKEKPRKMIHGFIHFDEKVKRAWKQLKSVYQEEQTFFDSMSKTDSGPLTDGKARRKKAPGFIPKSHNKQYCISYFTDERVRKSWYFYVQLLFVHLEPSELCKKFKMNCCQDLDNHTIACEVKWLRFKYFIAVDILEELGLKPWEPEHLRLPPVHPKLIQGID